PGRHDEVTSLAIEADVDLLVVDALLVQRLVGGVALHTCGLGVHGDGHLRHGSSADGLATDLILHVTVVQRPLGPQNSRRPGAASDGSGKPPPPDFWPPADLRTVGVCRCSEHYT